MDYPELMRAIERGTVQVVNIEGVFYGIQGATDELLLRAELDAMGAKPLKGGNGLFRVSIDTPLEPYAKKTMTVHKALQVRQSKAAKDGAAEYDRQRASLQRQATREIKAAYNLAIDEHKQQLASVMKRLESAQDPVEAIKLAYRRDELNAVIEALSADMVNAAATAERAVNGVLPQAVQVARDVAAWQVDNMSGVTVSRLLNNRASAIAVISSYDKVKYREKDVSRAFTTRLGDKYDAKAWKNIQSPAKAEKALRNAITRGVLTGEHPYKIAKRIDGVFNQWQNRAIVIARTETGKVMSGAFQEMLIEFQNDTPVKLMNTWDATLDGRTRDSHRKVDGETVEVGKKFSNGLIRPLDMHHGRASDVVNCRCSLVPFVDGFKPSKRNRLDNKTGQAIPYMQYDEWAQKYGTPKPKPQKAVVTNTGGIDRSAGVYKTLEASQMEQLDQIAQKADPRARALYQKFEQDLTLLDGKYKRGAHYSANSGVKMNVSNDLANKDGTGAGTTWFHEHGHQIDYLSIKKGSGLTDIDILRKQGSSGLYFSTAYKDGAFPKTIAKEIDGIVKAKHKELTETYKKAVAAKDIDVLEQSGLISKYTAQVLREDGFDSDAAKRFLKKPRKQKAYATIENEIRAMTNAQKADLSDIFEGATRCKVQAGWGHGSGYWRDQDRFAGKNAGVAKEAFAEYMSAYMANPESLEQLRKWLPETSKLFEEMLEELLK